MRNGTWTWTNAEMKKFKHDGHKLVVDSLVRAAFNVDGMSVPGKIAQDRLLELAYAESPELVKQVQRERDAFLEGVARLVNGVTAPRKKARK